MSDDLTQSDLVVERDVENMKKIDKYLNQHPELNSLIAEFLDSVLTIKPDNIADFATEMFFSEENRERLMTKLKARS